jgi:hypothetical protein
MNGRENARWEDTNRKEKEMRKAYALHTLHTHNYTYTYIH